MSDSDKKLDEMLQLRLVAITEDPAFQGNRVDYIKVFGTVAETEIHARSETEKSGSNSIH